MGRKIKVLVVDDSALMRKLISRILESDPDIQVVDTAPDGSFALRKIPQTNPDVITLDVEMSGMDGVTALERIMTESPLPVVMISSLTQEGTDITLKCLELGAIDFVPKPSGTISLDIEKQAKAIIEKVKIAGSVDRSKLRIRRLRETKDDAAERQDGHLFAESTKMGKAVVIGVSTGGPPTLMEIIPKLPADLPAPVFVVQHMPAGFTTSFAQRLDSVSYLKVVEARSGEVVTNGKVFVAPGGIHMSVTKRGLAEGVIIHTSSEPYDSLHKPSVDVMMKSAVKLYGKNTVGVILTGMGNDGTEGMKMIKSWGGKTIVEDEISCIVFGMPNSVIAAESADQVLSLSEISAGIVRALK